MHRKKLFDSVSIDAQDVYIYIYMSIEHGLRYPRLYSIQHYDSFFLVELQMKPLNSSWCALLLLLHYYISTVLS